MKWIFVLTIAFVLILAGTAHAADDCILVASVSPDEETESVEYTDPQGRELCRLKIFLHDRTVVGFAPPGDEHGGYAAAFNGAHVQAHRTDPNVSGISHAQVYAISIQPDVTPTPTEMPPTPTNTPTDIPPEPTPTGTPVGDTPTPTGTQITMVPPTRTSTPTSTGTRTPTYTPTQTSTGTLTPTDTPTPEASVTPTEPVVPPPPGSETPTATTKTQVPPILPETGSGPADPSQGGGYWLYALVLLALLGILFLRGIKRSQG